MQLQQFHYCKWKELQFCIRAKNLSRSQKGKRLINIPNITNGHHGQPEIFLI
jgi:hypothetical protein